MCMIGHNEIKSRAAGARYWTSTTNHLTNSLINLDIINYILYKFLVGG